jgi:hypothetical protein
LKDKGIKSPKGEWFECSIDKVRAAVIAIRTGELNEENRTLDFKMRPEQVEAVEKTAAYFNGFQKENLEKPPHFLWNAKMRFGNRLSTRKKNELEKSVGTHFQASGAKRLGGGFKVPY